MSATDPRETAVELRALQGPVLLRALLLLAFGLVTVFWQPSDHWSWGDPGMTAVTWVSGIFMMLHGIVLIYLQRSLNEHVNHRPGAERTAVQSFGLLYLLGGVLAVSFAREGAQLVLVAGLIYGIAGLTELLMGFRGTGRSAMARDWKIAGGVTLLTAVALFLVGDMGPKAIFGVLGGGALVTGVFQLLAALSFRHDAADLERRSEA
ncbi:hypothetical protein [Rothia halotolerans]|uniref:hypothetical protein n=1 Tax=Rothia halotolerans TaxID=405770 RepID=UPI00101D8931|nr:hypothetical protein [Rothia halotolerans]